MGHASLRAVELLKTQLGASSGNPHWQQIDERALARIMLPSVVDKKLRDTVTARMLRTLCDRTTMAQAEFMALYMVRCDRPGKTAPSSFNNNFSRFDLATAEKRAHRRRHILALPTLEKHLGCINRAAPPSLDARFCTCCDPSCAAMHKVKAGRRRLDWWWRSRAGILAQLEDRTLVLMENLFERLVIDNVDDAETVSWYTSVRDEMRERTR